MTCGIRASNLLFCNYNYLLLKIAGGSACRYKDDFVATELPVIFRILQDKVVAVKFT